MTSEEICRIMKQNNNHIPSHLYIMILNSSQQIDHIVYQSYGDYYEMWDCNGWYWRCMVFAN